MQVVSADDLAHRWGVPVSFVRHVLISDQTRRARSQVFSAPQRLAANDILRLIAEARDAGDLDEAFWRPFLATHFGRLSADPSNPDHGETAGRFLNAFGDVAFWTWKRVSADLSELAFWL